MKNRCQNWLFLCSALFSVFFSPRYAHGQSWRDLLMVADSANSRRQFDSAIANGMRALRLAQNDYPASDTVLASLYQRLGYYSLNRGGKYHEAAAWFEKALKTEETSHGVEDSSLVHVLLPLGASYFQAADYGKAEQNFKRHISIVQRAFGPHSIQMVKPQEILGALYAITGRYDEAEALHRGNLAIRTAVLGPGSPDVGSSLQNLSILYLDQGRFLEAESLSVKALALFRSAYGPEASLVAGPTNNLGNILYQEGKLLQARTAYLNALHLKEKFVGRTDFSLITTLNNLGALYSDLGEADSARGFLERALSIFNRNYGGDHPSSLSTLQKMGKLYQSQKMYAKAESVFIRSKAVAEKAWGPNHPAFSQCLLLLAGLHRELEHFLIADSLYQQAIRIRQNVFGPENIQLAECLEGLGCSLRLQGHHATGFEASLRAFRIADRDFQDRSSILSERDAISLASQLHKYADQCLSASLLDTVAGAKSTLDVARIVLRTKGRNADAAMKRHTLLANEKDSTVTALADQFRVTKFLLSKQFAGGSTQSTSEFKSIVDSLAERCNDLETELAQRSLSFRRGRRNQDLDPGIVASHLPHNSALVEYFTWTFYPLRPDTAILHYAVLVLNDAGGQVVRDLGQAGTLDRLIERYRRHFLAIAEHHHAVDDEDDRTYASIGKQVYRQVWAPINDMIPAGSTVYIAPDGGLNLVTFGGLVEGDGRYLIEKHPLHYLSAGRDLLRISQDSAGSGTGLLALGDPDYNASVSARMSPEKTFALTGVVGQTVRLRNIRSRCGSLSEMKVVRLPNTRTEVTEIVAHWHEGRSQAQVYLGPSASEENFKLNAPGRKVIHLATHGYFISGECEEKLGRKSGSYLAENPLLESGILLAGANLHGSDIRNEEAEDGILTALEVSGMDLKGTDLVVLSACESGLGKVQQGEGVYGLRRAFQLAGAKTVVSSLWQVPDDETMKFMKTLYSTKAATYPELMQRVALKRIKEARLRRRPTHPFTWGAFVATGDWRIH